MCRECTNTMGMLRDALTPEELERYLANCTAPEAPIRIAGSSFGRPRVRRRGDRPALPAAAQPVTTAPRAPQPHPLRRELRTVSLNSSWLHPIALSSTVTSPETWPAPHYMPAIPSPPPPGRKPCRLLGLPAEALRQVVAHIADATQLCIVAACKRLEVLSSLSASRRTKSNEPTHWFEMYLPHVGRIHDSARVRLKLQATYLRRRRAFTEHPPDSSCAGRGHG